MSYDIEYKQGDSDTAGARLYDDNGLLDLTDKTVTFVMKDLSEGTNRFEIPCTLGGSYQNIYYSPARGGVTIPFSSIETAVNEQFKGEFVISWTDTNGFTYTRHCPSGNNYHSIMIWEKV